MNSHEQKQLRIFQILWQDIFNHSKMAKPVQLCPLDTIKINILIKTILLYNIVKRTYFSLWKHIKWQVFIPLFKPWEPGNRIKMRTNIIININI